jgi:hypothetical protein
MKDAFSLKYRRKLLTLMLPDYLKIIFWLRYSCATLLSLFGPGMCLPVEFCRQDINKQAEHFEKLTVQLAVLREQPSGLGWITRMLHRGQCCLELDFKEIISQC